MDGGRILKSVKTSYAEYVGERHDRTEIVREMMKQQHKAMFIALRDGKFDTFVDGGAPPAARSSAATDVASAPVPEARASSRSVAHEGASHPPLAAIRPSRSSAAPSAIRTTTHLPPPPPDSLREKSGAGSPRASEAAAAAASTTTRAPLPRRAKLPPGPADEAAGDRRYAPTRPASIFGQASPAQGKTIFGEDPMSDKSLDEVILSYLSAELDEKK